MDYIDLIVELEQEEIQGNDENVQVNAEPYEASVEIQRNDDKVQGNDENVQGNAKTCEASVEIQRNDDNVEGNDENVQGNAKPYEASVEQCQIDLNAEPYGLSSEMEEVGVELDQVNVARERNAHKGEGSS
jgi:hypothetical protein